MTKDRAQKQFDDAISDAIDRLMRRAQALRDYQNGKPTIRPVEVKSYKVRSYQVGSHTRLIQTSRKKTVTKP